MSSLAWDVLGQHKLRCILCPRCLRMDLGNTSWDAFCVLAGMDWFWSIQFEVHLMFSRCKGGVWSTQVEIHFMSSLAWEGFGEHVLRCILCPRFLGIGLINSSWDTRFDHVEMYFKSSLAWDMLTLLLCPPWHGKGCSQHMLRYILCPL